MGARTMMRIPIAGGSRAPYKIACNDDSLPDIQRFLMARGTFANRKSIQLFRAMPPAQREVMISQLPPKPIPAAVVSPPVHGACSYA